MRGRKEHQGGRERGERREAALLKGERGSEEKEREREREREREGGETHQQLHTHSLSPV